MKREGMPHHDRSIQGLRCQLIAGGDHRLIQFALPGRDFETAGALQADQLIKRELKDGKWTPT